MDEVGAPGLFAVEAADERTPVDRRDRGPYADLDSSDPRQTAHDYRPLLRSAVAATAAVLVVKLLAILWVADQADAVVEVRWWRETLPYFQLRTSREIFTQVISRSTLAMCVAGLVVPGVAAVVRRSARADHDTHRGSQLHVGRRFGSLVAAETLFVEYVRHLVDGPAIESLSSILAAVLAVVGLAALALGARILRHQAKRTEPNDPLTGHVTPPIREVPTTSETAA